MKAKILVAEDGVLNVLGFVYTQQAIEDIAKKDDRFFIEGNKLFMNSTISDEDLLENPKVSMETKSIKISKLGV